MEDGDTVIVRFDTHGNRRGLDVYLSCAIPPGTWELWYEFDRKSEKQEPQSDEMTKLVYKWSQRQEWLDHRKRWHTTLLNPETAERIREEGHEG